MCHTPSSSPDDEPTEEFSPEEQLEAARRYMEHYIPDIQDYAKAEWMARGLPKPMKLITGEDVDEVVNRITSGEFTPTEAQAEIIEHIYNTMVHRETDGPDPLVQEPKGKP